MIDLHDSYARLVYALFITTNHEKKRDDVISHNVQAIILAAGKSARVKTGKSKLLETICGQELILYPTRLLADLAIATLVVTGYQKEHIEEIIKKQHGDSITFITQHEQHGTGHAIACTQDIWSAEHILIINGDIPLVTADIIENLYTQHIASNATISFVTAHNTDPSIGYGRVIKKENVIHIIEAQEFHDDPAEHCCINAGIYLIKKTFLQKNIHDIKCNNANKEFYCTDLITIASNQNEPIHTITVPFDRIRGINTLHELWAAEHIKRSELITYWMNNGVRFCLPHNAHVDLNVTIGAGSFIGSGVHLLGRTTIGTQCNIAPFTVLDNATVGDNTKILSHCVISNATIGNDALIGPFAHIKQESHVGNQTVIGNFVEIKKTIIGDNTKAKHLSYLGDAQIGSGVNIGAGTITCNHNGIKKNKTIIEDQAYIGANTLLIAPVTVQTNAFTAAGSVITHDVPKNALAIGRSQQVNKEGYALTMQEKKQKKNESTDESLDNHTAQSFIGAVRTTHDASSTIE